MRPPRASSREGARARGSSPFPKARISMSRMSATARFSARLPKLLAVFTLVGFGTPWAYANAAGAGAAPGPDLRATVERMATERKTLCGSGTLLQQREIDEITTGESAAGRDAMAQVIRELSTGQPVERAAAAALMSQRALPPSRLRFDPGDDDCAARRQPLLDDSRAAAARGLATLSTTNDDPDVWATAYRACHSPQPGAGMPGGAFPNEPRCSAVTAEGWARRDPGSAAPWLHAAGVSAHHGDAARTDAHLARAARASFVDHRAGGLARALAHPVFDPPTTLALWIGVTHLAVADHPLYWPNPTMLSAVADWCARRQGSAEGLADCRALLLLAATRNRQRAIGRLMTPRCGRWRCPWACSARRGR